MPIAEPSVGRRRPRILYVEPFDGGSHREFGRVLGAGIDAEWTRLTLPGRHWKWRMRGSAPFFALETPDATWAEHDLLFAGSYVALAELVGLRPELACMPRVLYFHENQFAYPIPAERGPTTEAVERDHHYAFTQLVSALCATHLVFNSAYNRDSFLAGGADFLRRMPDAVPRGWVESLRAKSRVLHVPLDLPENDPGVLADVARDDAGRARGPVILWNHRWEHDKGPDEFFAALGRLRARGVPFRLAVCGESYSRIPEVFDEARRTLDDHLVHWGTLGTREDYMALLTRAHVVVSAARQEFFGVAVLEAVWCGARPLVPDRLAYPEILPAEYRYGEGELAAELERLCNAWSRGETDLRADRRALVAPFRAQRLLDGYRAFIEEVRNA